MEKRVYQDPAIVAFFQAAGKPFTITPQRNADTGQVEFHVKGDGIDSALQELYANPQLGVLDFLRALKSFRSAIFALKSGRQDG